MKKKNKEGVKLFMNEPRVTEREILNAMIDGSIDPAVMAEYAAKKLAQMDKRNATTKVRMAKKRAENDFLIEEVFNVLSEDPMSRQDVLEALLPTYPDLTIGKVSYRLVQLAKEGRIIKQDATIIGDNRKNRRIAVYTKI